MTGRRICLVALAAALLGVPASAELFTVNLANGSTFDTVYRPQEAPWDSNKVLLRTDVGNWISVAKSDITSVVSATESGGFGTVIDDSTVELGMSANDAKTPEQLAEEAKANPLAAFQAQYDRQYQQFQQQQNYTIQQFVDPSQTQGLPANWVGYGNNVPQISNPNPMTYPPPPPQ